MTHPLISEELKQRMIQFFFEKGTFQKVFDKHKKVVKINENQSPRMETTNC